MPKYQLWDSLYGRLIIGIPEELRLTVFELSHKVKAKMEGFDRLSVYKQMYKRRLSSLYTFQTLY
jgi:hypothetical protein